MIGRREFLTMAAAAPFVAPAVIASLPAELPAASPILWFDAALLGPIEPMAMTLERLKEAAACQVFYGRARF